MSDELQRRVWRTDKAWQELHERIQAADENAAPVRRRLAPMLAAAAVVVAAIGFGAVSLVKREAPVTRAAPLIVTTGPGQRTTVRLPDSSTVILGPASRLSYEQTGARREVRLSGLASFDVPHDAARPFVVRARNAVATDLGTTFVVRGYDSDSAVEVSVSSGLVRLADSSRAGTIDLRPREAGRVRSDGRAMPVAWASAEASIAWIDGRLAFTNAAVADVVADLGRWFDVDITVASTALEQRRVSAVYNNPTLDGVLAAMAATLNVSVQRNGRSITMTPR